MGDVLVLWDLDGTLLNAGGVGGELYGMVFESMFGRPCEKLAPMAGRTDRAIILDTLAMAGIPDPRRLVDPFIERIRSQSPLMFEAARRQGRALTGAAEAIAAVASAEPPAANPPPARRRAAARRPAAGVAVSVIPAPARPADALLGHALDGNALAADDFAADALAFEVPSGDERTAPALASGARRAHAWVAGGAADGARAGLAPALDAPLVYPAPLAAVTRPVAAAGPAAADGPAAAPRPAAGTGPEPATGPTAGVQPAGVQPAAGPGGRQAGPARVSLCGRPRPESGRVYQSVLTSNVRPLAEVKLSAVGLRHLLDLCIGAFGDDHEVRAELVHLARRRAAGVHGRPGTDFSGEATVVVGDTPLDIEAALSAGARAVGVATGGYPASILRAAGAHAVLTDLSNTATVLAALLS